MSQNQVLDTAGELLQHPDFWRHYLTLAKQLNCELELDALESATAVLGALKDNRIIAPLPVRWQAMAGVAMRHMTLGAPLYFSDTLAHSWSGCDGTSAAECPVDRYRLPRSVAFCPVCGANTVPVEVQGPLHLDKAVMAGVTAAILQQPQFCDAFRRLLAQLGDGHRQRLLGWAESSAASIAAGGCLSPLTVPDLAAVVIALLHVTEGRPLYLTDELLEAWERLDGDGGVAECSGCGYRHPPGYPICVLCGSETAVPGLFVGMRGSHSRVN